MVCAAITLGAVVVVAVAGPASRTSAQVPDFLQVGSRLTWSSGDASLTGAKLVPDPNGWLWRDDQWYRVESTGGSGGIGYEQLDILANADNAILADLRLFLTSDIQKNINVPSTTGVVVGTADALGEYWVAPTRLAALQEGFDGTTRIVRGQRQINGQVFNVVGVSTTSANSYVGYTYDLASGLLLVGGSMIAGPGVQITDENGLPLDQSDGSVNYTHKQLVASRQRVVPWANTPLPAWATVGRTVSYQGETRIEYDPAAGMPAIPGLPVTVQEIFDRTVGTGIVGRQITQLSALNGLPPSESTADRAYGSAMLDGLWIPPDAFAQLQPQQVLDQDSTTGQTVTYGGVQGNAAVIVLTGPADQLEQYYDLTSGVLTFTRDRQPVPGAGSRVTELQLVNQQ